MSIFIILNSYKKYKSECEVLTNLKNLFTSIGSHSVTMNRTVSSGTTAVIILLSADSSSQRSQCSSKLKRNKNELKFDPVELIFRQRIGRYIINGTTVVKLILHFL